ncbi:hypothetical protein [Pseudoalteromonas shioyasakiensis]|uniref:hypothetical protein n=1 Tax=Pseudoalteromonas shioyasakiensis TaxID=1190813 RepID=UPI00255206A0|nr:hypothetical protein [Pseudoalteromonas shioyasakiensis]MDK9683645.1 hypothetical protein [Pseudoalteromonas shioyasakiensis]
MNKETQRQHLKAKPSLTSSWWANLSFIPNLKSDGPDMLRAESSLETLLVLKLLIDPSVKYVTTACTSKYIVRLGHRYTDDVEYTRASSTLYCTEVKQSSELEKQEIRDKLTIVADELNTEQCCFEVKTEHDICPRDSTANILRFFRHYHSDFDEYELIEVENKTEQLSENNSVPLLLLIDSLRDAGISYPAQKVWFLLAHKRLHVFDESKFINSNTLIWSSSCSK